MNLKRHSLLLFVLLSMALSLLAGCAASDDDGGDLTSDSVVEQAADAFDELSSASFALDIGGTIAIDAEGMLSLGAVSGEIARPSDARADASVVFGGSSVSLEMIASEGEMFMRNLLTGSWERAPSDLQYDPARIFDEEQGIAAIIDQLEEIELEGDDTVDGVDAHHLTGRVDTAAVTALAGDFFESEQLDVDIWVAEDDYRLLRVILDDSDAEDPMSWELTLSDHDEPVEIDVPELE